jgi:hypothetical protein
LQLQGPIDLTPPGKGLMVFFAIVVGLLIVGGAHHSVQSVDLNKKDS